MRADHCSCSDVVYIIRKGDICFQRLFWMVLKVMSEASCGQLILVFLSSSFFKYSWGRRLLLKGVVHSIKPHCVCAFVAVVVLNRCEGDL